MDNVDAAIGACQDIAGIPLYVRLPLAHAARDGLPQQHLDVGGPDFPIPQTTINTLHQLRDQCFLAAGVPAPPLTQQEHADLPRLVMAVLGLYMADGFGEGLSGSVLCSAASCLWHPPGCPDGCAPTVLQPARPRLLSTMSSTCPPRWRSTMLA